MPENTTISTNMNPEFNNELTLNHRIDQAIEESAQELTEGCESLDAILAFIELKRKHSNS